MTYKIGIFGSSIDESSSLRQKAKELGKILAGKDVILISGASTGIPYEVVYEAFRNGAEVWGFSPEIDIQHQRTFTPELDLKIYKKLIYVPSYFEFVNNKSVCKKYRNVISIATCDAGIIISGRWGTLNEFTNLYDMGKVIGVLTETGGIADELPYLMKKISKESKSKVLFNSSPELLVDQILNELQERN